MKDARRVYPANMSLIGDAFTESHESQHCSSCDYKNHGYMDYIFESDPPLYQNPFIIDSLSLSGLFEDIFQ